MRFTAWSRSICWLTMIALVLSLSAAIASADAVWLKSGRGKALKLDNVKVTGVQGDSIVFTTPSGSQTSKSLRAVPRILLDDEPPFNAAEEAFEKGDWAAATENYQKAISVTGKDWVKDRASLRLMEAANKSGNFAAAVSGFIDLLRKKPALAAQFKPELPKSKPDALDGPIGEVKQASQDAKLSNDQKNVLLDYLVELYNAKGDLKSAAAVLDQMNGAGTSPDTRKLQAEIQLGQARQQMADKKYAQAMQTLEANSGAFTEPQQQADALFMLAEAREATANASNPDQLRDAAISYMRVVANFKGVHGSPHVADSLLRAAGIEEKLKNTKEALGLYKQVAAEFKGSSQATQAESNISRLSGQANRG